MPNEIITPDEMARAVIEAVEATAKAEGLDEAGKLALWKCVATWLTGIDHLSDEDE